MIGLSYSNDTLNFLQVKCELLNSHGKAPTRAHSSDAGWDLYSSEDAVIPAAMRSVVRTGIAIAIPEGFVGLIWPRSGLSVKKGVDVLAGVIDAGYRGEIMVCLLNTDKIFDVNIKRGDRIAQILFQEVPTFTMEVVDKLDNTIRGEGKFGSSGH
jgi:dUTP pyrophosphatase